MQWRGMGGFIGTYRGPEWILWWLVSHLGTPNQACYDLLANAYSSRASRLPANTHQISLREWNSTSAIDDLFFSLFWYTFCTVWSLWRPTYHSSDCHLFLRPSQFSNNKNKNKNLNLGNSRCLRHFVIIINMSRNTDSGTTSQSDLSSQSTQMWIFERPTQPRNHKTYSIYSETGDRKRQHHRKSKNGCTFCRQRRIKVKWALPSLISCKANGIAVWRRKAILQSLFRARKNMSLRTSKWQAKRDWSCNRRPCTARFRRAAT